MPNFVPEGTIRIGRVPFDNSYRHTLTFESATAQQSYFTSVCTQALSRSDYTYVRMNNSIRVPFNAEDLYTYNYVMYQNSNYGNKWFYAFIVGVNYVNKAVTELVLELDVMQTWYFDYTLTEGFVEREHVDDDTKWANTVPEPDMGLLYSCEQTTNVNLANFRIIVQTSQAPDFDLDWLENIADDVTNPVQGGYYQGIWSAGKFLAFNPITEKQELKAFFEIMNRCGAAEAISSVFTYPAILMPQSGGVPSVGSDYGVQEDTDPEYVYVATNPPQTLGGYVPRNNKLFCYPYSYCKVTDNNGSFADYRWEQFELFQPDVSVPISNFYLKVVCNIEPQARAIVTPMNYAGVDDSRGNLAEVFTFPVTTQLGWVYSSYQNWLAQNSLALATSIFSGTSPMTLQGSASIAQAVSYLGMGGGSHNRLVSTYGSEAVNAVAGDLAYGATAALPGLAEQTAGNVAGVASDLYRMSHVPDKVVGRASDPTMVANHLQTLTVLNMYPTKEYCSIIDEFFDMYGYEVDRVKVPNRTGRQSWNYVKMRNSCHRGNVPAQDMAMINSIYDSGITFWHTPDVGNYSLSNAIV